MTTDKDDDIFSELIGDIDDLPSASDSRNDEQLTTKDLLLEMQELLS